MSMKGMGGGASIIRTNRGPPPPPRRSTLRLRLHRDRQHPVTVTGAELHYTCMYQACYEYEVGGLPQSYPNTHCK